MNIKAACISIICLLLYCCLDVLGQTSYSIKGQVQDTTLVGLPGANVKLLSGKDTLSTTTDSVGNFKFSTVRLQKVTLLVRSIGYFSLSRELILKATDEEQNISPIILRAESRQLTEVVIKGKVLPVRLMKDTVEYNAAAYTVRENDQLEDLLKQVPGMEVDKDGNVSTEGKQLTKLRVNGKDFFTSNVKDFLAQLPAGIVDKLQVIDDYGDKANFTGIKKGEPQKMLNLVLKPNKNRGRFGVASGSAGTNDRYALNLNANMFQDTKQMGFNGYASNTNTGAGISTTANLGGNYRDKISKNTTLSGNYSYGYNRTENIQESYTETINTLGTLYNQSNNESLTKGNNHNFDLSLQSENKEDFLTVGLRGSWSDGLSNSLSDARQTGVIRQNLSTQSKADQRTPNLNTEINFSHKLEKAGRTISGGLAAGNSLSESTEDQNNRIGYFDQLSGQLLKDSIRNQLVDSRNRNLNLSANLTFTEPLAPLKDTLVHRNIDFTFDFSVVHTNNLLETSVAGNNGSFNRVDTLSNQYTSSFSKHTFGINYRYDNEKLNYIVGLSGQPNLLTGAYEGRNDRVHRAGFNLAPVARIVYSLSRRDVFSLYYNGNSVTPNFNQLQPVPDTRNLQNIIIGNPDLKAAFNHSLNISYRHVNDKNGSSIMLGLRGTAVQDQVVANTVLIRDTLNSLRQETRYLNTSGSYTLGSNYMWTVPLSGKKLTVDVKGSLGYDHRIAFADGAENISEGINLNQGLSIRVNKKWLMLNSNANYNYKSNVYSLASSRSNVVQTWLFVLDARTFILKSLSAGFSSSKTINQGFSFAQANPLLLGGFVEKTFFKSRQASLKLQGNDLLNQGNNLNRTVTDNSITESKNNQVTRYFLLSFNWRLQSFGRGQG